MFYNLDLFPVHVELKLSDSERQEEEVAPLSPEQDYLRKLVASSLAEQVKELQVAVEREMSDHDKRLTERLGALEAAVEGKGKKGK